MKITIDSAIPFIHGRFPGNVEVEYLPGNEITSGKIKDSDALIIRTRTRCNVDLLEGSKVKAIATATIGTDHIDLPWCEAAGIKVLNAPGCNAPGVAQYLFSSIFKAGFDPSRHKLGIIGYGNVGSIVARWAEGMGIETRINDAPKQLAGIRDADYCSLEEVLRDSDAVTLHVPFTIDGRFPTSGLIGEKELSIMKSGAIIVNSSRGGVVDESALKKMLANGRLKAIIDVWENEPKIDKELLEMAIVATPHIAGYSLEGKMRATRMAIEALGRQLNIPVDIAGLECIPEKGISISRQQIEDSYDPTQDTESLKNNPTGFEELRNNYSYRHEPNFS